MEKAAIGTNNLGMHIVIRPISKDLLSEAETVGMESGKINSLLTARRPITLVDAISALPPLLPSSADSITGRRLYSVNEIMSGSCGMHFGPPVPELLRYETELSANTVLESSIASARSAAKRIPCNGQWLTDVLGNADPDSTMVAVETFADWSMARSVNFLVPSCSVFLLPAPIRRWRIPVSRAAMLSVLIKRSGAFHLHLIPFFHREKEAAGS